MKSAVDIQMSDTTINSFNEIYSSYYKKSNYGKN